MISLLLYLYIFVVSWGGTFTLSPWFPVHVILLLTAFILSTPHILTDRRFPKGIYHFEDIFIWIGIMAVGISGMLNPNEKTFNYLIAYFYVFGIGYFALKYLLYKKTSVNKLLNVNTIAVLFVAGFAVFDVALHFLTGIAIREFLPGTITATQTYHGVISRAYGFANEPGTLAFYFNTLGILALWELWKLWNYKFMSEFLKFFLTGLLIVAWICTRSAAGFAFMPFSVIIVLAIRFCYITNTRKIYISQSSSGWNTNSQTRTLTKALRSCQPFAKNHRSARRTLIVLATLSLTIFLVVQHFESVKYSLNPIIDKVTLQESSSSAEIRVAHWEYAIDNIFDNPFFGKGIGYLSSKGEGSSHDWYLFLALEAGLIATGSFVAFLLLSAVRILKSRIAMKYWFLVGFLASVFNFTISSTIFNPFLWILIAVFTVVEQKSKEQQIAI